MSDDGMPSGGAPPAASLARQVAFRTGVTAESRAAAYLTGHGYAIAARRFRSAVGEIDIVARRGAELLFVEVKARARLDDAAMSLTPRQQKRIVAAAEAWLAAHPEDGSRDIRFDVILVGRDGRARHIAAAFDASS